MKYAADLRINKILCNFVCDFVIGTKQQTNEKEKLCKASYEEF